MLKETNGGSQKQNSSTTIFKLPFEILSMITNVLNVADRCCLALTCKKLALAINNLDTPVHLIKRIEAIVKLKCQLSVGWLPEHLRFCITCGRLTSRFTSLQMLPTMCQGLFYRQEVLVGACDSHVVPGCLRMSSVAEMDDATQWEFLYNRGTGDGTYEPTTGSSDRVCVQDEWVAKAFKCKRCATEAFNKNKVNWGRQQQRAYTE